MAERVVAIENDKLDSSVLKRCFSRISNALKGLKYLDNSSKQLIQTSAVFSVGETDQVIDWGLVLAESNKDKKKGEEVNHKSFIDWLGSDGADEETSKVMLAYLIARLSTSMTRISVLTTLVLQEVCDESGLTFAELVSELGIACPNNPDMLKNHAMSQAFFDAMCVVAQEVMSTRGYESSRDVFAKHKTGKDAGISIKLGK